MDRFISQRKNSNLKSDLFLVEYTEKCLFLESDFHSGKKSEEIKEKYQRNLYSSQIVKNILFGDFAKFNFPKMPKPIYDLKPDQMLTFSTENNVYRNDVIHINGIFGGIESTPRIIFKKGFCDDSKNAVIYSKKDILEYYIFTILPKSVCKESNSLILYTVCKYKELSSEQIRFTSKVDQEILKSLKQEPIILCVEKYCFDIQKLSLIGIHVLSKRPNYIYWNQFSLNNFGFLVYDSDIQLIINHNLIILPRDHNLYTIIAENENSIFLIEFLSLNHFVITFQTGGFYIGEIFENYEMEFSSQNCKGENVLSISFRPETNLLALGYGIDEKKIVIFKFNHNLNLEKLCCIYLKSQICCLTWINNSQIFASGFKNYQIWYCVESNYLKVQTCVHVTKERNLYILKNPENDNLALFNPKLSLIETYYPTKIKKT